MTAPEIHAPTNQPRLRPEQVVLPEHLVRALHDYLASCEPSLSRAGGDLPRWGHDLLGDVETCLLQQTRVLLSMQIPLAEAPGFRELLAAIYGEGFFLRYHNITDCHGQVVTDFPPHTRCVHGHVPAEQLRARFPQGELVTWVREPVQRVAEQYRYWLREPDLANPTCRALHEQRWSLLEFARQDAMRNKIARYFGKLRPADFAFIGIVEDFAASVDVFRHRLQITAVPLLATYRATPPPPEPAPVSVAEREEISRLNAAGCALYAECRARHEQAVRALP